MGLLLNKIVIDKNLGKQMENLFINKNLLVVEDDMETNTSLKNIFNVLGFNVDTAFDGHEGLEKISHKNYDLIFTDIEMPNLDGYELIKKSSKIKNNLKIIILSANTQSNVKNILNNEKIPVLSKPFNLDELINISKTLLLE